MYEVAVVVMESDLRSLVLGRGSSSLPRLFAEFCLPLLVKVVLATCREFFLLGLCGVCISALHTVFGNSKSQPSRGAVLRVYLFGFAYVGDTVAMCHGAAHRVGRVSLLAAQMSVSVPRSRMQEERFTQDASVVW